MTVLISDIDDTLAKNHHRSKYIKNDLDAYFQRVVYDSLNKIGYDLYKSINAAFHIILSTRPVHWVCKNKEQVDLWYLTLYWLKYYKIPVNDLMLHDPKIPYEKAQEDKLVRLKRVITYHNIDNIVYLETNESTANYIKNIFPNVDVHIITSAGARRLL